ncbi:DoxX family membrane protein [Actinomadura litoris]|uniref:DoxX family membrane protein n=1 Tax=Actinomadura litoris TaxID=2678616 RepID=A0A7K1L230_9ACTN|nr:DoxX family membrane protein [Actinomadura litoris]MUN38459.1 DoxX family membrane protein [Actinomadura litoris]
MSVRTHPTSHAPRTASHPAPYVLAVGRLFLAWIFLWAFLDKLFGFGKPTKSGWLDGTSPSKGFLSHTEGPFKGMFHAMAGQTWVDAAFVFGLGGLGIALTLGIGLRIAAAGGTLLLLNLWAASLWPEANPFMDEHWIYAALLVAAAYANAGDVLGLGGRWSRTALVRRYPFLR